MPWQVVQVVVLRRRCRRRWGWWRRQRQRWRRRRPAGRLLLSVCSLRSNVKKDEKRNKMVQPIYLELRYCVLYSIFLCVFRNWVCSQTTQRGTLWESDRGPMWQRDGRTSKPLIRRNKHLFFFRVHCVQSVRHCWNWNILHVTDAKWPRNVTHSIQHSFHFRSEPIFTDCPKRFRLHFALCE